MKTHVELFPFVIKDDTVHYGKSRADITGTGVNPDAAVRSMLDKFGFFGPVEESVMFVHSTSWRFEDEGSIVLTYMAYCRLLAPDPRLPLTLACTDVENARQSDSLRPRPEIIQEHHVVSHGLRHLSFLACEDGDAGSARIIGEDERRALSIFIPQMAGQFSQ